MRKHGSFLRSSFTFFALPFALQLLSSAAQANQIYFKPTVMYLIDNAENQGGGNSKENNSRQLIDVGFGFIFEKGLTVGGIYATEKRTTETTTVSGASSTVTTDRTSLGAGVGWSSPKEMGPFVMAYYFPQSTYVNTTTSYNYSGSGYQLDLGVRFKMKHVYFGLQLSYKFFEYKEYTVATTKQSLSDPLKHTNVDPYISVFFQL
jgi:hypothetical protein